MRWASARSSRPRRRRRFDGIGDGFALERLRLRAIAVLQRGAVRSASLGPVLDRLHHARYRLKCDWLRLVQRWQPLCIGSQLLKLLSRLDDFWIILAHIEPFSALGASSRCSLRPASPRAVFAAKRSANSGMTAWASLALRRSWRSRSLAHTGKISITSKPRAGLHGPRVLKARCCCWFQILLPWVFASRSGDGREDHAAWATNSGSTNYLRPRANTARTSRSLGIASRDFNRHQSVCVSLPRCCAGHSASARSRRHRPARYVDSAMRSGRSISRSLQPG